MITKRITKRVALQMLKDYFRYSERRRLIGAGEILQDIEYNEKVDEINVCYFKMLELSDGLKDFDLQTLN